MVNKNFTPSKQQRRVLDVLQEEYQTNPKRIRDVTGMKRQRVNDALNSLQDAGWIENPARGLYRIVYDGTGYLTQDIHHTDNPPE